MKEQQSEELTPEEILPVQPSRRTIRIHAFLITMIAGTMGVLLVTGTVETDWKAILAVGAIMIFAFLIHASKSAVDLNKWMDSATRMVEARSK